MSAECSQMMKMTNNNGDYRMQVKVGTPPIEVTIVSYFGNDDQSYLGEWILDKSIKNAEYLYYLRNQVDFYNYQTSTTAKVHDYYISPRQYGNYGDSIQGYNVDDVLEINGQKIKREFTAVDTLDQVYSDYQNGQTVFQKGKDSLIDQLYNQGQIKTRDYILQGIIETVVINDFGNPYTVTQYNVNVKYDLDATEVQYKSPSNDMTKDGSNYVIMAHGIYINGKDVTDKLKYKQIYIDKGARYSSTSQVYVPSDIYSLVQSSFDGIDFNGIQKCQDCKCEKVLQFPNIKLMTQEYIIYITPQQYTYYQKNSNACYVSLQASDNGSYDLFALLLFTNNVQVLYQKSSNQLKLYGLETTKHMQIKNLIIVISVLNGMIFLMLVALAVSFLLNFKLTKLEQIKYTKMILQKIV